MLKKIKQYLEWLFQGNILSYIPDNSHENLLFEGKSRVFWKILLNSFLSLSFIFFPLLGIVFQLRHPVIILVSILLSFSGFLFFCAGIIAFAYQPFWVHKNKIILTNEGLYTKDSIGIPRNYYPKSINLFAIRFEFIQPQIVHLQFWMNGNIRYFVNAYVLKLENSESEIFNQFKKYMLAWDLNYVEISPKSLAKSGKFVFAKKGKTKLDLEIPFEKLKESSIKANLEIGETPELISKYIFKRIDDIIEVTRPKNYNLKMWIAFLLSFFLGGAMIGGIIYSLVYYPSSENTGLYFFLVIVALLWIIFSLAFYSEAKTKLLLKINEKTFLVQKKKGKQDKFPIEQIKGLSLEGAISRGRFTTITANVYLILKNETTADKVLLVTVDSDRPEKMDTQLVRDNVYERSMRVAQLIAKPMRLSINWEGFK